MRSRKPCLLTRWRVEGWNVLFIILSFYIFFANRTAKVVFFKLNDKFFLKIIKKLRLEEPEGLHRQMKDRKGSGNYLPLWQVHLLPHHRSQMLPDQGRS